MKKISKDIHKIIEYRDQINSGLFQIYKTLTHNHVHYIHDIIKMRQSINAQLETLISNLIEENK